MKKNKDLKRVKILNNKNNDILNFNNCNKTFYRLFNKNKNIKISKQTL